MPTAFDKSAQSLIRSFKLSLQVEGLSPVTVAGYVHHLEKLARFHPERDLRSITASDLRSQILDMQTRVAPGTVRAWQIAVGRFFKWAVAEGETNENPTANIRITRAQQPTQQPTYSEGEIRRLLMVCDPKTRMGARDRAVVMVLADSGCRVGELVSMVNDVDWEHGRLSVRGKTGRRVVKISGHALQALDRYVRRWPVAEDSPLWLGTKGRLSESGILQLINDLAARAGIDPKGVHAFRRFAASEMKRLGAQDSDVLQLMGWKSITMLRRYVAVDAQDLAEAAHSRFSPGDALARRA